MQPPEKSAWKEGSAKYKSDMVRTQSHLRSGGSLRRLISTRDELHIFALPCITNPRTYTYKNLQRLIGMANNPNTFDTNLMDAPCKAPLPCCVSKLNFTLLKTCRCHSQAYNTNPPSPRHSIRRSLPPHALLRHSHVLLA